MAWIHLKAKIGDASVRKAMQSRNPVVAMEPRLEATDSGKPPYQVEPITMRLSWPTVSTTRVLFMINLKAIQKDLHVYNIFTDPSNPHFQKYQVLVDPKGFVGVVTEQEWTSEAQVRQAILSNQEPLYWAETAADLALYGTPVQPKDLTQSDPSVIALIDSTREREYSVFGIPIDTRLYFPGVGIFIGIFSLSLIGPLRVLLESKALHGGSWVMASSHSDKSKALRVTQEVIAVAYSGAWVMFPLLILAQQCFVSPYLKGWEVAVFYANALFLVATTLINSLVVIQLRALRVRPQENSPT